MAMVIGPVAVAADGSISGVVTAEGVGPIADVMVVVWDDMMMDVASNVTGADGTYVVQGLGVGEYRVEFRSDSYANEWFENAVSLESASPVVVSSGQSATVNAELAMPGMITGTVTASDGSPLEAIQVNVYDVNWNYAGTSATATDGSYAVSGLAAGDYKVEFDDQTNAYSDEWFEDAADFYSATAVSVGSGGSVSVDAVLATPGTITGTVTDEGAEIWWLNRPASALAKATLFVLSLRALATSSAASPRAMGTFPALYCSAPSRLVSLCSRATFTFS